MKKSINLTLGILATFYLASACNSGKSQDKTVDSIENMEDSIGQSQDTLVSGSDASLDTTFAIKAADAGLTEVATGKLAVEKGQDQGVKDFGQMMVEDHSKANEQLKAIAARKNMTLPTQPSAKHQEHIKKLQAASGQEFDKLYVDMMVNDHKKVISAFEMAAQNAADIDLKNFASQTLPVLQKHLKDAQSLQEQIQRNR